MGDVDVHRLSGAARRRPRAVLLDALGTLVELEPPAAPLRRELHERFALEVTEARAGEAVAREIAYYRAHHDEGRDRAALAMLRRRCAAELRSALPAPAGDLPLDALSDALMAALRFRPYPDSAPALRALRARGIRLVVVSNWDVSLHEVLARTGLGPLVDGAIASAELGSGKPDVAIFRHALTIAGVPASAALHAGDSYAADVLGARAAGVEPVLVVRDGREAPEGVAVVRTLAELARAAG